MNFLYKECKSKKKMFFWGDGGEEGVEEGGGARVSDLLLRIQI